MAELTPEQIAFLAAHRIPLGTVFDASGMRKPAYQMAMSEAGKSFAFGVTPCRNAGHTLRTRAGHCIQCDHATIAYMLRHDAPANIYVAGSMIGRLIKVGTSSDVTVRKQLLNSYRYGGQFDWQILASANTPAAGRVECEAHSRLARFNVIGYYEQGGRRRRCYELFKCNYEDAASAVLASMPNAAELRPRVDERVLALFRFRD